MAKIKQNSYVLFFYNDSKKWLIKISKNDQLHTHIGVIKHSCPALFLTQNQILNLIICNNRLSNLVEDLLRLDGLCKNLTLIINFIIYGNITKGYHTVRDICSNIWYIFYYRCVTMNKKDWISYNKKNIGWIIGLGVMSVIFLILRFIVFP